MDNNFDILKLNSIAASGLGTLPENLKVTDKNEDPHAIILRSYDLHEYKFGNQLLAVARAGAGVNNIPIEKLSKSGVVVFNTPGANANAVKELVISAMLLSARNLFSAYEFVKALTGNDDEIEEKTETGKKKFSGFELHGRTLGIVGLGAIGVMVANAAHALGMKVIGFDPAITIKNAWRLSANVEHATDVNQVFAKSDFISFHVPLNDKTRNLFSTKNLSQVKSKATLLNFSRDGIVEHAAIAEGIKTGKLRGYISDFPCSDLQNLPGVVSLPHLGASTAEAEENCAVMACEQLKDFLLNGNITNSVNLPEVYMPKIEGRRLAIINQNIPNMLAEISGKLGKAKINIVDMINKSRGDFAYTLVDAEGEVSKDIVQYLEEVPGIIKVRVVY